jgi:alanyl-tRNA synthetase
MTANDLRALYLQFFKEKQHEIIPSASLIPENDATVLFTTAGMQPLVPYLLGEKHPAGTRLVNVQKCLRTVDIDNVGDDTHHTFFQMLGNWSLGDYFKKESIAWSFEFLTASEWLGLSLDKLAFTVYEGGHGIEKDEESFDYWKNLGVPEDRIAYWGEDNFWSAGETGPCGPSSEIFYWSGSQPAPREFDPNDETWVEIWNNVFMTYDRKKDGELVPLKNKNIDTGMGFERTLAALDGKKSSYETDLFQPIIKEIEKISHCKYEENARELRIIADHVRAAVFLIGDKSGVVPSNVDQGYVLRSLIRRSIRIGKQIGIEEKFVSKLAKIVIENYSDFYRELEENKERIISELDKEENKFWQTLEQGLKEFDKGTDPFILFTTYGFPIEMTVELAKEKGTEVDVEAFEKKMKEHQNLSRAGAEQKFKGGLADHGETTTKLHTATHLLHAALRQVLGDHVAQKGSNITPDRLRFDFVHEAKMTDEEKQEVEKLVNDWISQDSEVQCEEIPYKDAKDRGVIGLFEDKYGDVVKVYSVADVSAEMCGGPHVVRTGELGHFKIKKEESSSAGIRRIKAILE